MTPPAPPSFDCLWCGRAHTPRSSNDLEVWAKLCPDCLGRAPTNPFLTARLRAGLAARAAANRTPEAREALASKAVQPAPSEPSAGDAAEGERAPADDLDAAMARYYAARAGEYDDWYLRRGRYSHGAIHDMAWQADLDAAGQWLDALPFQGEIVELAAGTGWWSTLLAQKGTLWLYDAVPEPLDRARERLLAHGLRAHIHVRDAWAEPDRQVQGVFAGFWLSHVARDRLGEFFRLVARWLEPGGLFAFIDSRRDPASGGSGNEQPGADDLATRRLADGSEYRVRKVFYEPAELAAALAEAGFRDIEVGTTSRFFVLGAGRREDGVDKPG